MTDNIYRCSPRKVKEMVADITSVGLVPFVQSSPGMGKSSIVRGVAKDYRCKLIDHRLSTSDPTDLSGLPRFDENGYAYFSPFRELFPLSDQEPNEDTEGWVIFLDEFNSASKEVQAASYKLILDRMVGQHHLHEKAAIVAAGNLSTDRAITNPISTAMQSRVIHIDMELNFKEWMEDVALAQNFDKRVIAFLNMYPSKLMDFRPDHNDRTFACPRTWEFVHKLIANKPVLNGPNIDHTALIAGTITSGMAVDFVQFTKVYQTLLSVKDILNDPEGCLVPSDNATKWATITHILEYVDDKTFDGFAKYASRFAMDFQILFFRFVMIRKPELRSHPAFAQAMLKLNQYLK